jgi:hypothetical protein
VLADTNYSSGESYAYLESQGITAYIPVHGSYLPERKGFIYNKEKDCYVCNTGAVLSYCGIRERKYDKRLTKVYRSQCSDCRHCPQKELCCKTSKCKEIEESVAKPYYDAAYQRMNTTKGKQKMRLRSATVEPVFGTLLYYRGMKKVYTKGNELAHKQLLMATAAYNLKKLMNFRSIKTVKTNIMDLKSTITDEILIFKRIITKFWNLFRVVFSQSNILLIKC